MARKSIRSETFLLFLNKGPSQQIAWFIGMVFGDGNVFMSKNNNRVSIGVCGQLKSQLMEYIPFGEHKLKRSDDFYNIYIDGKESAKWFLDNFDICGPKSGTIKFPDRYKDNALGWHFIRGFFDADGHIIANLKPKKGNPKLIFGISSKSKEFLEGIANYMVLSGINRVAINIKQTEKVMNGKIFINHVMVVRDQPSIRLIYENLYTGVTSKDFFMERKRNVFKDFYASNHEYGRVYLTKKKDICITGKPVIAHGVSRLLYDRYSRAGVLNILQKRGCISSEAFNRFIQNEDVSKLNQFLKNNLISYYIAKHEGFLSPAEAWNGKILEKNLSQEMTDIRRSFKVKPASWFRLQDALSIVDKMIEDYGITSIIDPFSGWGVRMTAAMLRRIPFYGVDANTILQYEMKSISQNIIDRDFCIVTDNAYEHQNYPFGYDSVFSCPPYWNAEDYGYKFRSIRKYSTFLTYLVRLTNNLWSDSMKVMALSVESFSYKGTRYDFHEDLPDKLLSAGYKITPWVYRSMYRSFNKDYRDLNVFFVTR